jgi:hypothetical protein
MKGTKRMADTKPILNIRFINFWDKDEIIFPHYFQSSHCFLFDKYDIRVLGKEDVRPADVHFCSVFGNDPTDFNSADAPRILLVHENVPVDNNTYFEQFDYILSFTKNGPKNNIRVPYWVYRIFDQYSSYVYDLERRAYPNKCYPIEWSYYLDDIILRYYPLPHQGTKFCAYLQGNAVAYRTTVVEHLSQYKKIDCGGKHLYNLDDPDEIDLMNQRLYGMEAHFQKMNFLEKRKFSFCMENAWTPGYVTEKIIDSYVACTVPLYCGILEPDDNFNPKSFLNIYDYSDMKSFVDDVKALDMDDQLYQDKMQEPLFTKFPDQFRADAMLEMYDKMFERKL